MQKWLADARVSDALAQTPRALSDEAVHRYIEEFDNRTSLLLGIHRRFTEELLGFYTFHINTRHLTGTATLVVGEDEALNQAVAVETARAIVDWAFDRIGLEKIIAQVAETNIITAHWLGSRMQLEGRLRDEIKSADGNSRVTVLRFGLLRSEWAGVRKRSLARQQQRGY